MKEEQLIRFIERKCTAEEVREVFVWINTSQENKRFFHELQTI